MFNIDADRLRRILWNPDNEIFNVIKEYDGLPTLMKETSTLEDEMLHITKEFYKNSAIQYCIPFENTIQVSYVEANGRRITPYMVAKKNHNKYMLHITSTDPYQSN